MFNVRMSVKNKVVIVTGGTKGIGNGCARVIGQRGGKIVYCCPHEDEGHASEKVLQSEGIDARWIQCDVRFEEQVKSLIAFAVKTHGRLDTMINNAGWHPPAVDIDDISTDDFESLLRLNLTSTFWGCKYAVPHLRQTRGSIINIASKVGLVGQGKAVSYVTTKAAQVGLTLALAKDLAADGVRVNAVCPAGVRTPMMEEWAATLNDPDAAISKEDANHAMGRMATIEEIANVCAFLASDDASFVTGQAICPDGGAGLGYQRWD